MIAASVVPYTLMFAVPAGTSRGIYSTRRSHLIVLKRDGRTGVGECAPLPNLSCDDIPNYTELLDHFCERISAGETLDWEELRPYPSMLFGFETAYRDLASSEHILWDTPFTRGESGIAINGLIWMGSHEYMLQQIDAKIAMGFKCLKLKVGAIDFEQELDLVSRIRKRYYADDLEIRLDANGGFSPDTAIQKLEAFHRYHIHSIEQPIRANQVAEMAALIKRSPIPIALDEELIGVRSVQGKMALLEEIHPHYIILKPSLHGGLLGCEEWIDLAEARGIGWWATSALESNIGLNAIAQWTSSLGVQLPQGLGTGLLFTNNVTSPLFIKGQELWYDSRGSWDMKSAL